jgi:hypothetical protein
MTADLARYVLPSRFIERYRPVKSHRYERALGGYFFDPNAADFFIRMATETPVPGEAVWTVLPGTTDPSFTVASGFRDAAIGYVICETPFARGENLDVRLARQLTYRARVRLAVLRQIYDEISKEGPLPTSDEIAAFVQRRIDEMTI